MGDQDTIPLGGGFSSFWFSHCTTTSLFPFAPPRFAARLHRDYGNSDFCRTLQPACSDAVDSLLSAGYGTMPTRPGPFIPERSRLPFLTTQAVHNLLPTDLATYLA